MNSPYLVQCPCCGALVGLNGPDDCVVERGKLYVSCANHDEGFAIHPDVFAKENRFRTDAEGNPAAVRDGGRECPPVGAPTLGWSRFPFADPVWGKDVAKVVVITWSGVFIYCLLIAIFTRHSMDDMMAMALASFNPLIPYLANYPYNYWDIAWPGGYLPVYFLIQAGFITSLCSSRLQLARMLSCVMLIGFVVKRWFACAWILLDLFLS